MDTPVPLVEDEETSAILRAALDALPAQVVVLDAEGLILATNAAWRRLDVSFELFGVAAVEPGASYYRLCRESRAPGREILSAAARAIRDLMTDDFGSMVQTCPNQGEGGDRTYVIRAARVQGDHRARVIVAHQELGDYWALGDSSGFGEADARRQAAILRTALDGIGDAVIVVDRDGQFLLFNPAAERLAGMGRTDLSPVKWRDAWGVFRTDRVTPVPSDEMPLARALRGEVMDHFEGFLRSPLSPEGIYVHASSRPLHDEAGRLIGGLAVVRDVTERRRSEQIVRQKDRTNRALLDAIPDLVCRLGRDGRIRALSAGRDFGPAPPLAPLQGLNLAEVHERYGLPPREVVDNSVQHLDEALRTGETVFFETRVPLRDDVRLYETRLVGAGPDEVLAIVRDVTERRRVEAHPERSSRMLSAGTLAAGMAHKLSDPLTHLTTRLESIGEELERIDAERPLERIADLREWLEEARRAAEEVLEELAARTPESSDTP